MESTPYYGICGFESHINGDGCFLRFVFVSDQNRKTSEQRNIMADDFDRRLMERQYKICPYCTHFAPESDDMRGECLMDNEIDALDYCEDFEKGRNNHGRGSVCSDFDIWACGAVHVSDRVGEKVLVDTYDIDWRLVDISGGYREDTSGADNQPDVLDVEHSTPEDRLVSDSSVGVGLDEPTSASSMENGVR